MKLRDFGIFTRSLPEPHLLVSPRGSILACNSATGELFRTSPHELSGASLIPLLVTPRRELLRFLSAAAGTGRLIPGRLEVRGEEARSYPAEAGAVSPAAEGSPAIVLLRIDTSDQGNPFLLLTRKVDELTAEIRRRMALEEERERLLRSEHEARTQAEEANRLKDDFLATLSHELRTPLHAILGWTSLMQSGTVGPEERKAGIRTIERAASAQSQLVESLLDFARIIGGQLHLDFQCVNLSEVAEAALEAVGPSAAVKEVEIEPSLDPEGGPVRGDPVRLQQVVWNLLSNAIKFSPSGSRVQVRVMRRDDHAEIVVADEGKGIAAEFLPHVFDRFRQEDSSHTRADSGVGLGLSIAQQLVEAHAGDIHAASAGPGKGATFTVRLPLVDGTVPSAAVADPVC